MDLSALCLWGLADLCGLAGLPVCICQPPWWAGMLYACSLGEEAASDEDNSEAACSSRQCMCQNVLTGTPEHPRPCMAYTERYQLMQNHKNLWPLMAARSRKH